MKSKEKLNNGITLVALVITIIVLLILAGISIQAITNTGIFTQANNAKRESEIASIKEQIALDIYEKQLEPPVGSITEDQLKTILEKHGTIIYEEDGVTIKGITTAKGYEILLKDIYGGETVAESVPESIPDGATVTPVNDITTWLKTGEISKQYSYTTIEGVIADSTCTESLMKNENAMKYLARSTEFANAICASETAMTSLGESTYVDDTVLNSDIWVNAICDSAYFEKLLTTKVPSMTSATSPYGEVVASQNLGELLAPYRVFSGTLYGNNWGTTKGTTTGYIGYIFPYPVCVKKIKVVNPSESTNVLTPKTGNVQGYNGNSWVDIQSFSNDNASASDSWFIDLRDNGTYYLGYRLNITSTHGAAAGAGTIQFYGIS